jgi:Raf kinase inhibitor-like YbhB/YbcL family protein
MDLQHTMRSLIRGVPRIVVGGVPAERAGDERLAWRRLRARIGPLRVFSNFADGESIPFPHSAAGGSFAPPVMFMDVPPEARELALIVEDPDAPTPNPFVHWLVHGIPPQSHSVGAALAGGAHQDRNSLFRLGFTGCAPPKRDHAHRYVFQLFALDLRLPPKDGLGRKELLAQMTGHVICAGLLMGTFRR